MTWLMIYLIVGELLVIVGLLSKHNTYASISLARAPAWIIFCVTAWPLVIGIAKIR